MNISTAALAVHDSTSLGSKVCVGLGNGYCIVAALASDLPVWVLCATPLATAFWLFARGYALIKRANYETRNQQKETNGDGSGDSSKDS